jgi:hypothetical protein
MEIGETKILKSPKDKVYHISICVPTTSARKYLTSKAI